MKMEQNCPWQLKGMTSCAVRSGTAFATGDDNALFEHDCRDERERDETMETCRLITFVSILLCCSGDLPLYHVHHQAFLCMFHDSAK